jgi:hypothetical protein
MNVLSTIPISKYKTWTWAEKAVKSADGDGRYRFWLVNVQALPAKTEIGDFCYMVHSGFIRGYFEIVDIKWTEDCRSFHRIGKPRNTWSLVLATWHDIDPIPQKGFQGFRYTSLSPVME